jgi:hypothetical protein
MCYEANIPDTTQEEQGAVEGVAQAPEHARHSRGNAVAATVDAAGKRHDETFSLG